EPLEGDDFGVRDVAGVSVLDQGLVGDRQVVGSVQATELDAERPPAVPGGDPPREARRSALRLRVPDVLETATDRITLRHVQLSEGLRVGNDRGKRPVVGSESEVIEGAVLVGAELLESRL